MTGTAGLRDLRTGYPPPLRRRAVDSLQAALSWTGGAAAYVRFARPSGAVILMYHSVPRADLSPWVDPRNSIGPGAFRDQMRFLVSRRRVISMARLADLLESGESPDPGTVVLTFDDGYLDNAEVVAPILTELGLPATLYLPTGYISRGEIQWVDRLYGALRARTKEKLTLAAGTLHGAWDLTIDAVATSAYRSLCAVLIEASRSEREHVLGEVEAQLAPAARAPALTLDWHGVRGLVARHPLFEIGGHTVGHTDLSKCPEEVCRAEVQGCRDEIERETGRRPAHFSFPYGRSSPAARRIVAECGFRTAVADGEDVLISTRTDLLALPRIEAPLSAGLFAFRTSGAYPALSLRLLGRA